MNNKISITRQLVSDYLDSQDIPIPAFRDNMPGTDFAHSFLHRHNLSLSLRMCQNITRRRAAVNHKTINDFFDNLEHSLKDVPPENIVNYDETNLKDDPGSEKIIVVRGCKYPERVMDSSKICISLMFAASASGVLLPPYVVYKAKNLYNSWTVGGPPGSRYNRTRSGWFDSITFQDWLTTIAIPYLTKLNGKKVLIGDNLASHLSINAVTLCEQHGIEFVFLPSNSTHLTQPLDVAFFRPLKINWRKVLTEWKKNRRSSNLPKDQFPTLLSNVFERGQPEFRQNILSGFKKCGIVPLSRDKVLERLPPELVDENTQNEPPNILNESFVSILRALRPTNEEQALKKKSKLNVQAGKSVSTEDLEATHTGPSTSTGIFAPTEVQTPGRRSARLCSRAFSIEYRDDSDESD